MNKVTIYGASDDLVEIEGDLDEEFGGDDVVLAFGDGTVLRVSFAPSGVWGIERQAAGSAVYEKVEAPPGDEDNYSDRVTLIGRLRWVLATEATVASLHEIR